MSIAFHTEADGDAAAELLAPHLAAGKILGYPTETVYGLGSAPVPEALALLAKLKGRPAGKPFLLLVSGLEMLERTGLVLTPQARVLGREFWPGPLTLVLRGGEGKLPDSLRGPEGGIAVRWTSHRGMARLIARLGHPLTSTSANRPGQPAAPGPEAIERLFADAIAAGDLLVLDGGVLGNVPPSTLVDCSGAVPRLVREGAIPRAELRRRAGSMAP
ncbi:MAG TPA: L-threonylcarbamoyladenylate synthase [Gemmatimonadales bacterium]|jgi:L-threonylcarbamoyladenylate synthase